MKETEVLARISQAEETVWLNNGKTAYEEAKGFLALNLDDMAAASARLQRFAPLIERLFPETADRHGVIESPLKEIVRTQDALRASGELPPGRLFLKCDSHLAIAGSVKARGGIYEVLKHTEDLALAAGIISENDDYSRLADYRDFFSQYKIQVGSTGNLGMSIGIMSAALGYQAIVHMSADAKEWKKQLLREKGVIVKEYRDDYSRAVKEGRRISDADEKSYFVDDEHSKDLFLGYSVAGERLKEQLDQQGITVDEKHPLFVYLPCGVGGAPGGITFGLKQIWGDHVHCFFVEPVQAPCMCISMASQKGDQVCVQDYGLTGKTDADGLAVGRASAFVYEMMKHVVSGIFTVRDDRLYRNMKLLKEADDFIIEPSSCAAFEGYTSMMKYKDTAAYCRSVMESAEDAVHILWATGGSLMPQQTVEEYLAKAEF